MHVELSLAGKLFTGSENSPADLSEQLFIDLVFSSGNHSFFRPLVLSDIINYTIKYFCHQGEKEKKRKIIERRVMRRGDFQAEDVII